MRLTLLITLILCVSQNLHAERKVPRVAPSYSAFMADLATLCREVFRDGHGELLQTVSGKIGKEERLCLACRSFARAVEKSCSRVKERESTNKNLDVSTEAISVALRISGKIGAKKDSNLQGRLAITFLKLAVIREVENNKIMQNYFDKLFHFLLLSIPEDDVKKKSDNSEIQGNLDELF